jgi:superfamily II DNA or RNA helicase
MTNNVTNFICNILQTKNLKERFNELQNLSEEIKILVGYFYLSGYKKIFNPIKQQVVTKILVGCGAEKKIVELIREEFTKISDNKLHDESVIAFVEGLKNNKIEVRQTREVNHSKCYIFNLKKEQIDESRIILGSSNFTENGLESQNEMNYEIQNPQDTKFANEHFERLWSISIPIENKELINKIELERQKYIGNPYNLFLKALYSIYGDYLECNNEYSVSVSEKYQKYQFQDDAVAEALAILKNYNGVILGDVVGLGKSIVASKILAKMGYNKRTLILCSPALMPQWEEYKNDFGYNADVRSIGKIDNIIKENYDIIVVDEAHNFRSDKTKRYDELINICFGKKVILLSATIFNNRLNDIENLLYLFSPRNTTVFTGEPLQTFFRKIKVNNKKIQQPNLFGEIEKSALQELKENVLEKIMIRRTKQQIINVYKDNISFPESQTAKIEYTFSDKIENIFEETIRILGEQLFYARYSADNYLKIKKTTKKNEKIAKVLIRIVIIKRLESSVVAFKNTLNKITESYEKYCSIVRAEKLVPSNKKAIENLEDEYDLEKIITLYENKDKFTNLDEYEPEFQKDIESDRKLLNELKAKWDNISPDDDNKIIALQEKIKDFEEPFVIFTEAKDTAKFIYDKIKADNVILITGDDTDLKEKKEIINRNFNANYKSENEQENKYKILITTDVMAEGVNLHKANRIINYDLAWNPVRMMQRNGRVNRIGSKHKTTYIYNIFPTERINKAIKQINNIKGKIKIFLELLGNDEHTLSEDEILNWNAYSCERSSLDDEESDEYIKQKNYYL